MQLFPDAAETLAADDTGTPSMARVYLWSVRNLSFDRWTMLSQREVGQRMHLSQATIGRALADLAVRGFLDRRGAGPRQEWKLTPKGAWMGTAASYQKELRARGEDPEKVVHLHSERNTKTKDAFED